jgi:uncharacterized Zn-finger protein
MNTKQPTISVNSKDLPLSCPPAGNTLWNQHPRVYLAIEATGQATCPYCGSHYALADFGDRAHAH